MFRIIIPYMIYMHTHAHVQQLQDQNPLWGRRAGNEVREGFMEGLIFLVMS